MQGEELNATDITAAGILGDRAFALIDRATRKVLSAKNPKKWPRLFEFRAAYAETPRLGSSLPPVRITLPDGRQVLSSDADVNLALSQTLEAEVALSTSPAAGMLEEYWPEVEGLSHQNTVTDEAMPRGTFFDAATVHLLSTATLDALRKMYPQGRFEVRRFRPNVVVSVSDGEEFPENRWVGGVVQLGTQVRLDVGGLCPRCVMTTLPQADLPADLGILRAAVKHNQAAAGIYCAVVQSGHIARGDDVFTERAAAA